jgi:hypothetical protein
MSTSEQTIWGNIFLKNLEQIHSLLSRLLPFLFFLDNFVIFIFVR